MAKVLVRYEGAVVGPGGESYIARACGRLLDDHRWEGWIEFDPGEGQAVVRTQRETVHPNHDELIYWATGLTDTYLEGALHRALEPPDPGHPLQPTERPAYDGPAPEAGTPPGRPSERPHAILDPFHTYAQGEEVLRGQLHAMEPVHLRNIIRAYGLLPDDEAALYTMDADALATTILAQVREREQGSRP